MSPSLSNWRDLPARLASGVIIAVVGIGLVWVGGIWIAGLLTLACGLMIWELAVMNTPDRPGIARLLGGVAAALMVLALWIDHPASALLLLVPAGFMAFSTGRDRIVCAVYATAIMVAGYGLVEFRAQSGAVWLVWLILVVVVTDIAGYFAGRLLGGPKFWPAVSPKKTWAGTIAGWIAAAGVGYVFLFFTTAGPDLPWISAAIALASQMGDIAESAIKRRAGVKDSSALIPGHGGLLDRFDGLLGAALLMLIVAQVVVVPEVRI